MQYETQVWEPTPEHIAQAANLLRRGELVGMPTETVYGLAANALDEQAVAKIFAAKGRPMDNPLIVHIAKKEELGRIVREITPTVQKLVDAFWPGPLTMVLPRRPEISDAVTAGLDTVAVRLPSHPVARKLIEEAGVPLAAPSANTSGKPSPTRANHVYHDLKGKLPCILDGGSCQVGLESTVIAVGENSARILRPGRVTVGDLLKVVEQVQVDDGVFTKLEGNQKVASPGMKYKHYAPSAHVVMVDGSITQFCDYVRTHAQEGTAVLVFDREKSLFDLPTFTYGSFSDQQSQASRLFDALRQMDERKDIKTVYARAPFRDEVGMAVYNRLLRACGFDVVDLKNKTHVYGLTGQTGAGKSTVADLLRKQGIGVVDCDLIAREVTQSPALLERLAKHFGKDILEHGKLNRQLLADRAFASKEATQRLNRIMFPPILKEAREQMDRLAAAGHRVILLDAPTLFESGADAQCDAVITVVAKDAVRCKRIMQRDGLTKEQAQARMDAQLSREFLEEHSDYLLVNDGTPEELKEQVLALAMKLKHPQLAGSGKGQDYGKG